MTNVFAAVFGFLGGAVAIGPAVLHVLKKWLEVRVTEPIKAEFAKTLAEQRQDFERQMADRQADLQKELKRFDKFLERQTKDEGTAQLIEQIEYPILHEADRIIRRVDEVMGGKFPEMYSRNWISTDLTLEDLDGNKKVTAVYRLMRLFGFYALYLQRSAGLPPHPLRGRLRFYLESKIEPIFASGRMFAAPVMFRDMILELSENMLSKSDKWDTVTVIGFTEWMEACKSGKGVIPILAERLSELFTSANPRLAMLGIYLIDLRQDTLLVGTYEFLRARILDWLQHKIDPDSVTVWGFTRDRETDLRVMDIPAGKIPRNFRSHFYDTKLNPMNYILPES
jgi:hypothetical protein